MRCGERLIWPWIIPPLLQSNLWSAQIEGGRPECFQSRLNQFLITHDSCLANDACSRCLEALQKARGRLCTHCLQSKTITLILLQCHLPIQVLVVKAVIRRFGWLDLLIRWLMTDCVLIRLTNMQLFIIQVGEKCCFKQQGQQTATFPPVIRGKACRCCSAWCVYLLSQQMDIQSCILLQLLKLLNAFKFNSLSSKTTLSEHLSQRTELLGVLSTQASGGLCIGLI